MLIQVELNTNLNAENDRLLSEKLAAELQKIKKIKTKVPEQVNDLMIDKAQKFFNENDHVIDGLSVFENGVFKFKLGNPPILEQNQTKYTYANLGTLTADIDIDISKSDYYEFTVGGDINVNITGVSAGERRSCVLKISDAGSHSPTFSVNGVSADFVWKGGSAPSFSSDTGKADLISVVQTNENDVLGADIEIGVDK